MIDFFNETWKNKPKPFKYNSYIAKKKKLNDTNASEIRETSIQKTVVRTKDGKSLYNKRKINELPGFISQLNANLAMPLACEHVFFNYEFITGMFHCSNHIDIMDNLNRIKDSSSYSLSSESKKAQEEIQLCTLIFLQAQFTIIDNPQSAGMQIVARSLILYGHSKYFTQFIDQYDTLSSADCALIVPYQFMSPPGSNPIFCFEKHIKPICCTSFDGNIAFTLSDKLVVYSMISLCVLGNFILEKTRKNFSHLIVYSFDNYKSDDVKVFKDLGQGGFLVANDDEILSYSFEIVLLFRKTFVNEIISNVFIINKLYFLVSFQEKNYFDIYEITSGELKLRKIFDKQIKLLTVNTFTEYVEFFKNKQTFIVVCFESAEITILMVRDEKELSIELVKTIAKAGFDCYSLLFIQTDVKSSLDLVVTLTDGSILLIDEFAFVESGKITNALFIKPITKKELKLTFKSLTFGNYVFIGSNNNIYTFWQLNDVKIYEIPGTFDNASFNNNKTLITFENGLIRSFYLDMKPGDKVFEVAQLAAINGHTDKVIFHYHKDNMMLTTSLDSTMKCFIVKKKFFQLFFLHLFII